MLKHLNVLLLCILAVTEGRVGLNNGVCHLTLSSPPSNSSVELCVSCLTPTFHPILPRSLLKTLQNSFDGVCDSDSFAEARDEQVLVYQNGSACSFERAQQLAVENGVHSVSFASLSGSIEDLYSNVAEVLIPLYLINNHTYRYLEGSGFLTSPGVVLSGRLETDLKVFLLQLAFQLLTLLFAVASVLISYFLVKCDINCQRPRHDIVGRLEGYGLLGSSPDDAAAGSGSRKEESVQLSASSILIGLVVISTLLVLLYFFFDYLWYVLTGFYLIWVTLSLTTFSGRFFDELVYSATPSEQSKQQVITKYASGFTVGVIACIIWALYHQEPYVWILWDVMSLSICVYILTTLLFDKFLYLLVLGCCLVVYDVFFVYVTPLFTASGKSIMEEAVTGREVNPSGNGQPGLSDDISKIMPMIFVTVSPALPGYTCISTAAPSLLGMGDVIMPGLMIIHAARFGLRLPADPTNAYAIVGVLGYVAGLGLVSVVLQVMQSSQPALLYIIPILIPALLLTAWARSELSAFVHGHHSLDVSANLMSSSAEDDVSVPVETQPVPPEAAVHTNVEQTT